MKEENEKLSRVRKSFKTAKIVGRITEIILIVAFLMLLVTGIVLIANSKRFNEKLAEDATVSIDVPLTDLKDGKVDLSNTFESDVPAVQKMIDENNVAAFFGLFFIGLSLIFPFLAAIMHFFAGACKDILEDNTPFSKRARKKILVAMILLTVGVSLTKGGIASGVVLAIVTWCIYTILDYGALLQLESDETL